MIEGLRDISTEHGVITDGIGFVIPAKTISVMIEGVRD